MDIKFERCADYALITLDRRGFIRQQNVVGRAEALAQARQLAKLNVGVTVEDAAGNVIFESH